MSTRDSARSKVARREAASSVVLSPQDVYLFNEGTNNRLFERLGAHLTTQEGIDGVHFAVWAPNAERVTVIGDFNQWNKNASPLQAVGGSGIWAGFIEGVKKGAGYKYHISSRHMGYRVDKTDPFALYREVPPKTASIVWDLEYEWNDAHWLQQRHRANGLQAPTSIYEVHLGSWRRVPEEGDRFLTYRELAEQLPAYVKDLGFTHVEFMPVTEHPFYGSWGYQTTGFFAPSSRFGTPQDFMYLIDALHQHEIGVILDWVPSHFPTDEHGLAYFDGTHLYEHADPRQGYHPDWNSYIFNYGRNEVRSFLLSSALFWLEKYHIDGLRVDAVASMLYLDYSRPQGQWIPNQFGGRENLEAISFLRRFNEDLYQALPDVQTVAEESTAWPMVSRPTYIGGLGFGMKWDMGWMHDSLRYFAKDPIHRKYHHNDLTFRSLYAFNENFVLPLSHDEVVHGKGSLIGKMPGDVWQKFANLRLLLGYMYATPGKKLLFMGSELGQFREWNHDTSLDWHLLDFPLHAGLHRWVKDLNAIYRRESSLHELDFSPEGFEWVDANDNANSVLSFIRKCRTSGDEILIVLNCTPKPQPEYRIGVPTGGRWKELISSDAAHYGGSGVSNDNVLATDEAFHGRPHSLVLTLPPLGIIMLREEA